MNKILSVLLVLQISFLAGCAYLEKVDYQAVFDRANKASQVIVKSSKAIERTHEVADAIATVRGDYISFKEAVRPYLLRLPADVIDRAIEVDGLLIDAHLISVSVREKRLSGDLVIEVLEASQIIKPLRTGIDDLVQIAQDYQHLLDAETSEQFNRLLSKWRVINVLVVDIESQADKSMRVSRIKEVLGVLSALLPIAKTIITEIKK